MGLSADPVSDVQESTSQRPSILVLGPEDVGKRSVVRRLVRGAKKHQAAVPGGVATSHRWSIDTKYYTADVNLWVSHVEDLSEDPTKAQVLAGGCDALVLVFDLSEARSFASIRDSAASLDLSTFDVLLCVANKADLVADHHAHDTLQHERPLQWEQRHRLLETEDTPVAEALGSAPKSIELRRQEYSEWCLDNGIEYIETCALDEHFDERISADGDMQGIARLRSALHAHIWPGMVMKPKAGIKLPQALSGEESDVSIEYELLVEEVSRGLSPERDANTADADRAEGAFKDAGGKASGEHVERNGSQAKEEELNADKGPDEQEAQADRSSSEKQEKARATQPPLAREQKESPAGPSSSASVMQVAPRQSSNGDSKGDEMESNAAAQAVGPSEDTTGESASDGATKKSHAGATKRSHADGTPAGASSSSGGPLVLDEAAAMKNLEHEGDLDFAEMERVLGEMSSVRDRLSGLPDAARRDEAASYA